MKLVLEPGRAARNYWGDVWRYRELLYFLAWRDLAVRYKQTAVGVAWAVLRPAFTMLVFVGFRRIFGLADHGVPGPLFVLAGVVPWQFFSSSVSDAAASLVGNAALVSKTYFPRLLIPCSAVVTSVCDFAIMLGMLAVLMLAYGYAPTWHLVLLPLFVALTLAFSLGVGLLFAALSVRFRDFRYVVPFAVQIGLFVSPLGFSAEQVPARWRLFYELNPLVGIIDGSRWCVLGDGATIDPRALAVSVIASCIALIIGVRYFRRVERGFADVI